MIRHILSGVLCVQFLAGVAANAAAADFSSSSNLIPNPDGVYQSTNAVVFAGDFPKDYNVLSFVASGGAPPPIGNDPPVIGSFNALTSVSFGDGSGGSGIAQGAVEVFNDTGSQGQTILGRYPTEILQLNLSGGTFPPGWMLRESPTLASTGLTTIAPQSDGTFRINSFFDVFTELSLDGGQTWTPASGPIHLESVPEPATLMLAAIGFAGLAAWGWRRRKR